LFKVRHSIQNDLHMKRADIFIQILSEVSGRPKHEIAELLSAIRQANPGGKWDEEIPENELEQLVNELRGEAPGIMDWLIKGAARVDKRGGNA